MLIRLKKKDIVASCMSKSNRRSYILCLGTNPPCPVLSIPDHVNIKARYKGESVLSTHSTHGETEAQRVTFSRPHSQEQNSQILTLRSFGLIIVAPCLVYLFLMRCGGFLTGGNLRELLILSPVSDAGEENVSVFQSLLHHIRGAVTPTWL